MRTNILTISSAIVALSTLVAAAPHRRDNTSAPGLSLTAQLQLADSATDRYGLLPNDEDFVFDFNKSQAPFADRKTFPALTGSGGSMAAAALAPCSIGFVHLHPRAAELFIVTSGRILTEMVPEAGVRGADGKQRVIHTELGPNQMTVFPAGSFHTQLNPDCVPARAVAAFTSEDGGTSVVASQTFALSDDVIEATFGGSIAGEDIEKVRSAIPQALAVNVEECLKRCGLEKRAA
ncbi:hypothetical protein CPLU01_03213 [Colletotrichum plurivorum]|uniref:Cupin type-1 domain-containing protein n=1 Tax=Colletotrichum plurivorum TaxID=2175906 RepID=A0A8H6KUD9_9PEZI|nr:hypothetical protein CPLU01_03213 [Colletotrichum plurivorum]